MARALKHKEGTIFRKAYHMRAAKQGEVADVSARQQRRAGAQGAAQRVLLPARRALWSLAPE